MGFLNLYAMVGEVKQNRNVVKCQAIFTDGKDYFIAKESGTNTNYEHINLEDYGKPQYLPASKDKIGDGKEYLFIYQPTKTSQRMYRRFVGVATARTVGIYDNKEFAVFSSRLSDDQMSELYPAQIE